MNSRTCDLHVLRMIANYNPLGAGEIKAIAMAASEIEQLRARVAGMLEQHHRDSAELRSLCAARDEQRDGRLAALERAAAAEARIAELEQQPRAVQDSDRDEYALEAARRLWLLPAMPKAPLIATLQCAIRDAMDWAAPPPPEQADTSTMGKLRLLIAAANRIAYEAEEVEAPDGLSMAILMDDWTEFQDALDEAVDALSASQSTDTDQQPAQAAGGVGLDERAAFVAWNNDTDCPLAGIDAKQAAWRAWQARALLAQQQKENHK